MTNPDAFNLVTSLLDDRLDTIGDRQAVAIDGKRLTWRELSRLVNRAGNAILGLDVGLEDRVLLMLPDGVEIVAAWLAAAKIGAAAICVDPSISAERLAQLLEYSRAKLIVLHARERDRIEEAIPSSPHLRRVIAVGTPEGKEVSWEEAIAQQSDELDATPTCGDDAACWFLAEAETPRAAIHSHRGLTIAARVCAELPPSPVQGPQAAPAGLHHGIAIQTRLLLPLAAGALVAIGEEGARTINGWGCVETGLCICAPPGDTSPGLVGRPLAGYEARIIRGDGSDASAGEPGTLWVRGEGTAVSYWRNRAETQRVFRGTWVVTGETFSIDKDGFVRRRVFHPRR